MNRCAVLQLIEEKGERATFALLTQNRLLLSLYPSVVPVQRGVAHF
jgi:hypothetical protein